jgi:hypothetical protein
MKYPSLGIALAVFAPTRPLAVADGKQRDRPCGHVAPGRRPGGDRPRGPRSQHVRSEQGHNPLAGLDVGPSYDLAATIEDRQDVGQKQLAPRNR